MIKKLLYVPVDVFYEVRGWMWDQYFRLVTWHRNRQVHKRVVKRFKNERKHW